MKKHLFVLCAALCVGCNDDSDSSNEITYCDEGTLGESASAQDDDAQAHAEDTPSQPFIDIQTASFTVTEDEVTARIELQSVQNNLTYNNENVLDNALEYSWEMRFDIDCDGEANNDVAFSAVYFNGDEDNGVNATGDVPTFTDNEVWRLNTTGTTYKLEGALDASLFGNTIVMTANKADYSILNKIYAETPFRAVAVYRSQSADTPNEIADDISRDSFPTQIITQDPPLDEELEEGETRKDVFNDVYQNAVEASE